MKKKPDSEIMQLRKIAEVFLEKKHPGSGKSYAKGDMLKLIHELDVHQIELEMQNEELRLTRDSAREAAEKYTELYDFAPFGYFTLTREGQIRELNFPGAQLLNSERKKLINSWFNYFVAEEMKPAFLNFLESLFEDGIKKTCEIVLIKKGGSAIDVHINGIANENKNYCLINVLDISAQKKAQRLILENQRLNAIGEMASSIAHDFNNSLHIIFGNLQLAMLNSEIPGSMKHYLETIYTTVNDASQRVKQLQRFGEKNRDKNEFVRCDLNELVLEVIEQSRPLWKDEAEKKGIQISIKTLLDKIPQVFADKADLRAVLFNLIKNSVEAMPIGGEITITTGLMNQKVFLTVRDTGIGMNEETRARIFQPFFSTKGFGIGRGLGMSGAYTIIREHHGNITVKSTMPGIGTIIELTLPFAEHNRSEESAIKEELEQKEKKNSNRVVRTLWIDDEQAINILVTEMVKILGHQIDVVSSAKDALEMVDRHPYDLIVTDIGMPGINGWQLADLIRKKCGDTIMIAVSSGWGTQITETEKEQHGVIFRIDKPFSLSQLKRVLEEVQSRIGPK